MILLSILLLLILVGLELWSWRLQREQRQRAHALEDRLDHLEHALRELASAQVDLHRRVLAGSPDGGAGLSVATSAASPAHAAPVPRFASELGDPPAGLEDDRFTDDERYAKAQRLAMAGASARTIASQCRLSEEEAELLLRLRGRPSAAVPPQS